MAVVALKQKPLLKNFHATVHVTRVEQWCVEAETVEEARELLAAGAGYRCEIGDCVNVEVEHSKTEKLFNRACRASGSVQSFIPAVVLALMKSSDCV